MSEYSGYKEKVDPILGKTPSQMREDTNKSNGLGKYKKSGLSSKAINSGSGLGAEKMLSRYEQGKDINGSKKNIYQKSGVNISKGLGKGISGIVDALLDN